MCLLMMAKRKQDQSFSESSEDDSESSAEDGEETEILQQNGIPSPNKVPRMSNTDMSKDPSSTQVDELKETENIFQSSLLRLQINELLTEVCLKDGKKLKIQEKIQELKSILLAFSDGKMYALSDTQWIKKKGLQVPVVLEPKSRKGNFQFLTPRAVDVVGSFLLDTCVKPNIHVDLAVTMPKECFQGKDHLNHRYIRKRALYLTAIAHHLRSHDLVFDLKFSHHHGDHLKPFLVMRVKDGSTHGFVVHLHVVPECGSFKLNRFHISKNNVRKYWIEDKDTPVDTQYEENVATPVYNTSVLEDLTVSDNTQSLVEHLSGAPGVRGGIILLKVWLRHRELSMGHGSFSGFLVSMFVVYLLSQRRLNKMMSSYQVFRNTLISLSSSDWCENPISLCTNSSDELRPSVFEFQQVFDVVFIGQSGYTNLCAGMTRQLFQRVVHEAKLALQFLDDRRIDGFDALFLKSVNFTTTFDHLFHLTNLKELHHCTDKLNISHKLIDYHGNYILACVPAILNLLSQSLGRRVHLIQMSQVPVKQWPLNTKPPKTSDEDTLMFGLLLNPELMTSVVEKGPVSDSLQAKEFIDFWGDRSELRRFQDGVICEAVVWTASSLLNKKRSVCSKIVKYVLQRHAAIPTDDVHYVSRPLDGLLLRPRREAEVNSVPYGTGEEQHVLIQHSYTSLAKQLRGLKDLPLAINTIQGVSPVFRFAEVFPAVPTVTMTGQHQQGQALPDPNKLAPPWTPSMEVICTLETSGKWPEDMEAVRRLKAAFLIQIGNALSTQCLLPVHIKPDCVHILKDGYIFRIKLTYSREITVSKMVQMPDGTVKFKDTEESVGLEKDTRILPILTSTLHGLYQQHNSFSCVVRLAKRWTAAQMLTNHIPEIAVELVVAHLYLHPAPFLPPGSAVVGFLRFLQLVSTFDWKMSPLIVNLNSKFSADDITEIMHKFNKERTTLPLMFISTPDDRFSSYWTKKYPTAPVLRQFVILAQKAVDVLHTQISDCSLQHDFKMIFRPSFEIFDVLIHLDQKQLPRQHEAVDITKATRIPPVLVGKYKEVTKTLPVVDYDPVEYYLSELKAAYGDLAMFCHDTFGGSVIGVMWKPAALQPKEFKVSAVTGRVLSVNDTQSEETVLTTNFGVILSDFTVIGKGLVSHVETLRVH